MNEVFLLSVVGAHLWTCRFFHVHECIFIQQYYCRRYREESTAWNNVDCRARLSECFHDSYCLGVWYKWAIYKYSNDKRVHVLNDFFLCRERILRSPDTVIWPYILICTTGPQSTYPSRDCCALYKFRSSKRVSFGKPRDPWASKNWVHNFIMVQFFTDSVVTLKIWKNLKIQGGSFLPLACLINISMRHRTK